MFIIIFKRGGEAVAYQGRKRSKTSKMLIITDSQRIPLAFSEAIAENHNDAFELAENVDKMLHNIRLSNISTVRTFP